MIQVGRLFSQNSKSTFLGIIISLAALVLAVSLFAPKEQAFSKHFLAIPFRYFRHACDSAPKGFAMCHAQVVTDQAGKPLAAGSPPASAFGPQQFHTGYQLPCTPGGAVAALCDTPSTFGPGTIAIVDAYNDPTLESDLTTYSNAYGIPPCTKTNGCLSIVNQNGGTSLPLTNSGWALEISLDVQVAHALCQTCKILVVEANSSSINDLSTAVNRAALMGATAISNSYGANEWNGETSFDSAYNHPGIAVTASSGDSGYGVEYPAASKNVVAVGGTTLQLFTDNTYASESVWNGGGSGCSSYETANVWQTNLSEWLQTNCTTHRGVTDISADADPNTGAAVYDSTPYQGSSGWWIVGGTSLASPIIASVYNLAGGVPSNINASTILYQNVGLFHDIVSGTNGNCATTMCKGATGYDGPTGLGSPNGIAGFLPSSINVTPTATPTPTLSPTPTATPTPTFTPTPTPIDTIAPVVAITQPADGSQVRRFNRTTIIATATDNVKVTKVEFYINNNLVSTKTTTPYTYNWNVPGGRNVVYTITVKAYDPSGNVGTTSIKVTSN